MRPILTLTVAPRFVTPRIMRRVAGQGGYAPGYVNLVCPAPRETKNNTQKFKKRERKNWERKTRGRERTKKKGGKRGPTY